MSATSYLVLATQRSGSTLLVESLRATGWPGNRRSFSSTCRPPAMAPQPREWFAGVEDESILRLLDPLDRRYAGPRDAEMPGESISVRRAAHPTASGAAS